MANPYFRNLPEFEYVNRTQRGRSEGDYCVVINFFKRGKLREDIFQDITFFTKYIVQGDDRPDTVASKVYNDPYRSEKMNILKYSVPEYIKNDEDLFSEIRSISKAEIKDGGEGAFYVFLKDKKNSIK